MKKYAHVEVNNPITVVDDVKCGDMKLDKFYNLFYVD